MWPSSALVTRLRASGLPVEALLGTFEDLQRQHEAYFAKAEGKAGQPG